MSQLKLLALDEEDLIVVSSHLQDAVMRVGDMAYLPSQQRFAAIVNRFDWEQATKGTNARHRAALRFDRVLGAKVKGLKHSHEDAVLSLLAVQFEHGTAPGGFIDLIFSGDAAVRLDVECIEAELKDLGPAWRARSKPRHPDDQP
jgi:hypothetical protein